MKPFLGNLGINQRIINRTKRENPGRKEKMNLIFIFTLYCGVTKRFMKARKDYLEISCARYRNADLPIFWLFVYFSFSSFFLLESHSYSVSLEKTGAAEHI